MNDLERYYPPTIEEALATIGEHLVRYPTRKVDEAFAVVSAALSRPAKAPRCSTENPGQPYFSCELDEGHAGEHQVSTGSRIGNVRWANKVGRSE